MMPAKTASSREDRHDRRASSSRTRDRHRPGAPRRTRRQAGRRRGGLRAAALPATEEPFRADQAGLRRRAGIDPSRFAARAEGNRRRRASRRGPAHHEGAWRRRARGLRARALRRRHDPRPGQALPERIHVACEKSGAQCALRRQQSDLLADGVGAELLRPRQWPPRRQPGRLPEFPEARADAQHIDDDRRLPRRADRHPSVDPPSRMHPRPFGPHRQGVPHLFARQGTQRRRHRDRADRARRLA